MKTIINYDSWERKESFEFFRDFQNPYIMVTCNVNGLQAKKKAKKEGHSFFLHYLHAILFAANNIEELRLRVDAEGKIVEYDNIGVIAPIKIAGQKGFTTMHFPYFADRNEFCQHAADMIRSAEDNSSFGSESGLQEFDVVLVSAIPDLPFTSLSCTQRHRGGNDYPLINVGMMQPGGQMPIALSVHHGFVDGEQMAAFYKLVQEQLDR